MGLHPSKSERERDADAPLSLAKCIPADGQDYMESCLVVSMPPVVSAPMEPPLIGCSVVLDVSVDSFLEHPERANAELRARPATSASAKYLRIS